MSRNEQQQASPFRPHRRSGEWERLLPIIQENHDPVEAEEHPGLSDQGNGGQVQSTDANGDLPVYATIHRIRREIVMSIDDPYSVEQLKSPRINMSLVRPLVDQLYDMHDVSVVFCLLVNKIKFMNDQTYQAHHQSVNITRANLCELVAIKVLRKINEDCAGPSGLLRLANVLVAGFDPFQNAPEGIIYEDDSHKSIPGQSRDHDRKSTALELAILSTSKQLLSASACQRVVDAIYVGKIVYTPTSLFHIIPDRYKTRPISLYDPRKASTLNQYRLLVPRTRNIVEFTQFVVLLVLYFLVLGHRLPHGVCTVYEYIFLTYGFGWVLSQVGRVLEHGWLVYTQNLWSFLDAMFVAIFAIYFSFRAHSLVTGSSHWGVLALNILATGAPILVPRLAFNLMSENMLFVSLRAMMADFAVLSVLAVWCFAGFLFAMRWLSNGEYGSLTISTWMIEIWFGLSGTGIEKSADFHWLLGPILMVAFAMLGNTLFLTILVSMLANTFSNIVANATAEIQYRRAVLTIEGVTSDSIVAYPPPFNILVLIVLLPLSYLTSPRWFHKVNVVLMRTTNAPLLFLINAYEKRYLWKSPHRGNTFSSMTSFWSMSRFSVYGNLLAVFETEPPESIFKSHLVEPGYNSNFWAEELLPPADGGRNASVAFFNARRQSRKESVLPENFTEQVAELLTGQAGSSNQIKDRLRALEKSGERMERMLRRLCIELGEEAPVKGRSRRDSEDDSLE